MKDIDVLIVDDNIESAKKLRSNLAVKEKIGAVECAASEKEAMELLKISDFDVMVLDIIMSQNDGFHCLEELNRIAENAPDVIMVSAINHEGAIRKSFELGAKYYMIKPYDPDVMYARIMDLKTLDTVVQDMHESPALKKRKNSLDHRIMEILIALSMPPHLKGYQYLREAIKMTIEDPEMIYSITKRLYPAIAEKFDATPTKVELAIRHTIEVAWQRNKMENATKVFGLECFNKNSRPTNGELIALIADKISIDMNNE